MVTRRWPKRLLRSVLVYGCIPYLSIVVIFAIFQRKMMYHPTVAQDLSAAHMGLASGVARDVRMETNDGHILNGWLIHHSQIGDTSDDAPLVIYFPGNAGNRHERLSDLLEIAASGFDVLMFDYRGFGDSTGGPSESALASDAQRIWQFARTELKYEQNTIVIFGESLGGAVALSMWSVEDAKRPRPAAVILNSTFATMPDVVASHYPWFPFQYLLLDHWRSSDRIPNVESPIIVFHGTADDIVPISQGRLLSNKSRNSRFIEIPGGSHNNIPMDQLRHELQRILSTIPKKHATIDLLESQ